MSRGPIDMSGAAVLARLKEVSRLADLRPENRLAGKINMSDEAVTARIRAGEGSLGKLLNDDAMARSLSSTTSNLDKLTHNLDTITGGITRGEGTLGKLTTSDELFNRLTSMTDRLDKLVASLQQGNGTAGLLLHDKQLYENMNKTVAELHALVTDIRADPKKYLNVRVSLF